MKIVSACLAGLNCRHNGTAKPCQKVIDLITEGKAIPICPEQLGGLPTPRAPAEQKGDRIITENREDFTSEFGFGANEVLKIAKTINCKEAILKSKSPSCGSSLIYDGTFSKTLTKGDGVLTKLLKRNGIRVLTEDGI